MARRHSASLIAAICSAASRSAARISSNLGEPTAACPSFVIQAPWTLREPSDRNSARTRTPPERMKRSEGERGLINDRKEQPACQRERYRLCQTHNPGRESKNAALFGAVSKPADPPAKR